ncbi:MAG: hypothetical protein IJE16_01065 [Ruminococcus sp.]|nr:hypothetical protein [Ruminococcus sp.]
MKRLFALLLAVLMVISLTACGEKRPTYGPVGEPLVVTFEENSDKSAQEIADLLLTDPSLGFMGATMPVEEGLLNGFGNAEITGFDEGVMFGPAIGTIPFIGYVFTLSDDTNVKDFKQNLQDNADLRWNICTEADELVVEDEGDKVIVIMTPNEFDSEGQVPAYGEEFVDEFEEFEEFE